MNSTDLSVLRSAVSWLKAGHPVAIATVVQTWGSAPRPIGSWLAIRQDGQVAGSVSGGCVEDDLIRRVQTEILTKATPEMVVYGVSQQEAARFGLPCGGTLRLLVEPKPELAMLEKLLAQIAAHQITRRTVNFSSGKSILSAGSRLDQFVCNEQEMQTTYGPRWRMVIIGAGQLSLYTADFALASDFEVIVIDPREEYAEGMVAPVFFGSAVNNFGVREMLETFVNIAPAPRSRETSLRKIEAGEDKFSGFIFKIHANLDPKHRDRIGFMRVCSGRFERNKYYHHVRLDKDVRFSNPYSFLARSKDVIEDAYPGDVVGLFDTGNFKIGDTLTEGEDFFFTGIPTFSPEIFKELVNKDPMKTKQMEKGVSQLTDEGVAQLFTQFGGNKKIIGCVGELQFEVIQYRLLQEYGAACEFRTLPFYKACWLTCSDEKKLQDFLRFKQQNSAEDKDGNPVYLAQSEWFLNTEISNNPDIKFHFSSEVHK
jgi:xanthine/CO dehydrogenase XdhC/CoxF family maturation factor